MDEQTRRSSPPCPHAEAMPPASALRNEPLHRLFKGVGYAFQHQMLQQMRAEGITELFPGATPLILHLGEEDGLTLSELGKRCALESSTMTPLVNELERHNLAARVRDPDDRRVVRLYLTESGRILEPRLRALVLRLQEHALSGVSAEDLATLHRVLQRMTDNLEHYHEAEM